MELLDYKEVYDAAEPAALLAEGAPAGALFDRLLRRYPLRRRPNPDDRRRLAEIAWRTLRTPLPFFDGQPLAAMADRRHEMTFWLPAPGAADLEFLGTRVSRGLLTGAIDLVVRHDGCYFILDLKTNLSKVGGYGQSAIDLIMEEHHYHLQYQLYAMALRRLLCGFGKIAGFSAPAGAGYLFARGMTGNANSPGIFHTALSVEGLDEFEFRTLPALLRRGQPEGDQQ